MKAKYRFLKVLIALFSMLFLVGCFRMTGYSPSELKTEKFGYDPDWQSKYESNEEVTEEVYTVEEGIDAEQDDEEDSDDEDSEDDSDSNSDNSNDKENESVDSDGESKETGDKDLNQNADDSKSDNKDNANDVKDDSDASDVSSSSGAITVTEDGEYITKDEVALYIHTYNHLPSNFITKNEATELGWISSKGNLGKVAPGKSIGGDKFGNREGLLPKKKGRTYYECDINFDGTFRNGERIVFSDDGLIYYTGDHYESFELLYE